MIFHFPASLSDPPASSPYRTLTSLSYWDCTTRETSSLDADKTKTLSMCHKTRSQSHESMSGHKTEALTSGQREAIEELGVRQQMMLKTSRWSFRIRGISYTRIWWPP